MHSLTNRLNAWFMALSMMMLFACAPMSKESYLEGYREFVHQVSVDGKHFSVRDRVEADKNFKKYSELWYAKFKDEFTFKEKIVLGKYEIQYNMYKAKHQVSGFFKTFNEEDYDDLKKQISY